MLFFLTIRERAMAAKLKQVEVDQKHVHGHQFHHEELNGVQLDVESDLARFNIVIDSNGLDVVSDQPSSLMGSAISWAQVQGLVQGDLEIAQTSTQHYLHELEEENSRLKAQVAQLTEELSGPTDDEYAVMKSF